MGCGTSTDNVKFESKASLETGVSSRASSSTRTPTFRNKARVAPEVISDKGTLIADKRPADKQSPYSCADSAKTTDGHRRKSAVLGHDVSSETETINENVSKKAVAFDITLGGGQTESIVKQHPPRRLQKLEFSPHHVSTLKELEARQQKSAAKRKEVLEKKAKTSQRSSTRRNDLLEAVKYSQEHQQEVTSKKLVEKIDSASKNREKHQADTIRKQKARESKARQARERRLRASMDDEDYDVEKDETYNADDDVDSWIDEENNGNTTAHFQGSASSTTASEQIYDGWSSPVQRLHGESEEISAQNVSKVKDDFFD